MDVTIKIDDHNNMIAWLEVLQFLLHLKQCKLDDLIENRQSDFVMHNIRNFNRALGLSTHPQARLTHVLCTNTDFFKDRSMKRCEFY